MNPAVFGKPPGMADQQETQDTAEEGALSERVHASAAAASATSASSAAAAAAAAHAPAAAATAASTATAAASTAASASSAGSACSTASPPDDEIEPLVQYQRLGGSMQTILSSDCASCLAVHSKFLALGTRSGAVHVLDLDGNEIRRFRPHSDCVNDVCIDAAGGGFFKSHRPLFGGISLPSRSPHPICHMPCFQIYIHIYERTNYISRRHSLGRVRGVMLPGRHCSRLESL